MSSMMTAAVRNTRSSTGTRPDGPPAAPDRDLRRDLGDAGDRPPHPVPGPRPIPGRRRDHASRRAGRLVGLRYRNRASAYVGQELTAQGTVIEVRDDGTVRCEVTVTNAEGVTTTAGEGIVAL